MIASLWAKLQYWFLMLGASLLVLAGAYAAGSRSAKQAQERKSLESRMRTREEVDEIIEEVRKMDSTDLSDEFDRLYRKRR